MRVRALFAGAAVVVASAIARAQHAVVIHVKGQPGALIQQADDSGDKVEWLKVCTSPCTARVPANTYYRAWQSLKTPSGPVWLGDDAKEVTMTVTSVEDSVEAGTSLMAVGGAAAILGGVMTVLGGVMELATFAASFSLCFGTACPPPPDHTSADVALAVGVATLVTGLVVLAAGGTLRREPRYLVVGRTNHHGTLDPPWTQALAERTAPLAPPVIGVTLLQLAF
jgi:hypothetical protein